MKFPWLVYTTVIACFASMDPTSDGAIGNSGNGNRKWKMETVKTWYK